VNGEVRQDASTSEMVFRGPDLIDAIQRTIALTPGDLIPTGTPSGVG
jgi:2-keto-4-pentenoate hydratase/2-oxohepta-3-ene-1,7-dioic acid hydratase in catechol pathway